MWETEYVHFVHNLHSSDSLISRSPFQPLSLGGTVILHDMLIKVCTHACFLREIIKMFLYIAPSTGYLSPGKGLTHCCITAVLSIKDKKSNSSS